MYAGVEPGQWVQAEREEKLRMVEFYNARLTEREKRRDFLRARGLLNMKRMQVCHWSWRSARCALSGIYRPRSAEDVYCCGCDGKVVT